ncbi:hypothetical protein AVL61_11965 [Kocuria rosea subsp. polaris]|uniref:Uncharacterized protein n=1 Tax=Kocuria rosea subsp. polaris TaxID=136273 RepID=A0A0W8I534_KOCRO|nr:hypothetical protein AVL61_11965 [Kocuria polaris]
MPRTAVTDSPVLHVQQDARPDLFRRGAPLVGPVFAAVVVAVLIGVPILLTVAFWSPWMLFTRIFVEAGLLPLVTTVRAVRKGAWRPPPLQRRAARGRHRDDRVGSPVPGGSPATPGLRPDPAVRGVAASGAGSAHWGVEESAAWARPAHRSRSGPNSGPTAWSGSGALRTLTDRKAPMGDNAAIETIFGLVLLIPCVIGPGLVVALVATSVLALVQPGRFPAP